MRSCFLLLVIVVAACTPDPEEAMCPTLSDADCAQATGGPPADACRVVGGEEQCVLLCAEDGDCLDDFHASGCTGVADEGSAYCE